MADDQDQSSKTEDPTERRLKKLRDEGNVPRSKEVNNLFMLFGFLLVTAFAFPVQLYLLRDMFGSALQNVALMRVDSIQGIATVFQLLLTQAAWALAPTLAILVVLAFVGGAIQTGILFSTRPIEPKLEKVSLIKGFERLFSVKSLMEFLKSILKLIVIGAAMWGILSFHADLYESMVDKDISHILNTTYIIMLRMIGAAMAIMVVLAIIDYMFEQQQFTKQNRMSLRDLKDEFKETEGDPIIKQRQRQLRQERARRRMMQEVPQADVVITNPTHFAVALSYKPEEGMAAPTVIAKGADFLALKIREIAQDHNIPLYEDPPLARQLFNNVEIEQEIPLELYEVTAKVIAYVMDLKRKKA